MGMSDTFVEDGSNFPVLTETCVKGNYSVTNIPTLKVVTLVLSCDAERRDLRPEYGGSTLPWYIISANLLLAR